MYLSLEREHHENSEKQRDQRDRTYLRDELAVVPLLALLDEQHDDAGEDSGR